MKPITVIEIGKPGAEACACIDMLNQGFCTPLCDIIQDELDEILNKRYVTYNDMRIVHNGVSVVHIQESYATRNRIK